MARKKSQRLLEDDLSSEDDDDYDSGGDGESSALSDGAGRKRKRRQQQQQQRDRDTDIALYGDDGDGDDDDGDAEARGRTRRTREKKVDHLRPQAFVPAKASASAHSDDDDSDDGGDAQADAAQRESGDDFQPASFSSSRAARRGIGSANRGGIGMGRPPDGANGRDDGHDGHDGHEEVPSHAGLGSARAGIGSKSASKGVPAGGGIGFTSAGTTSSSGLGFVSASASSQPQSQPQSARPAPTFAPAQLGDGGVPTSFGAPKATPTPAVVVPSDTFTRRPKAKPSHSHIHAAPSATLPKTSINFGSGSGGGFNPAAYLASMGWTGGGLGAQGEGMVNPIEVSVRPERAGIAFGGRKEKPKSVKEEARRRGEAVSSSSEDQGGRGRRGKGKRREKKSSTAAAAAAAAAAQDSRELRQAWTREKRPRRPKVQHRTYEEIIASAEGGAGPAAAQAQALSGQIIDARTGEPRQVASLASALAAHPVPTSDSTQLPELRHNLRLIVESATRTLEALAREGAGIVERRRWLQREKEESQRRAEGEAREVQRVKRFLAVVRDIEAHGRSQQQQQQRHADTDIEAFEPVVRRVQSETDADIAEFGLDEALVAAMTGTFKRAVAAWEPLEEPQRFVATLQDPGWRKALRVVGDDGAHPHSQSQVDVYGRLGSSTLAATATATATAPTAEMRPFDSLLWHVWLPRVRSALNNDWSPRHPSPATSLLSSWRPLLPAYMWDNLAEQVLLPKLRRALHDWDERAVLSGRSSGASLHHVLFPWLPLLGRRADDVLAEGRRRIKAMLKAWRPRGETGPDTGADTGANPDADARLLSDLHAWRPLFPPRDFSALVLAHALPKLASHLRAHLSINPAKQDLAPLARVLPWRHLMRGSTFSRLLEVEFFAKWLRVMHAWLAQPGADVGEVAQWYAFWKGWFPVDVVGSDAGGAEGPDGVASTVGAVGAVGAESAGGTAHPHPGLPGVQAAFRKGIELLHAALALSDEERADPRLLPMPDVAPLSRERSEWAERSEDREHREHRQRREGGQRGTASARARASATATAETSAPTPTPTPTPTFRSLVEEHCAARDVLVVPLHRAHTGTGAALFRAVPVDGDGQGEGQGDGAKGGRGGASRAGRGVTFYMQEDVLFAQLPSSSPSSAPSAAAASSGAPSGTPGGEYTPVSLDALVDAALRRAKRGTKTQR